MSTRGRKQRSWRTLRCVVEVKVPPSNRSTEKDLSFHVSEALADYKIDSRLVAGLPMPRSGRPDTYYSIPKVKGFTHVFRAEAKRPPEHTVFEKLVIRALYAILMFTMPRSRSAREAAAMLREDLTSFVS